MNNTEKNFIQGLKEIRLNSEAKARIREHLVAYSELHSMPVVESAPFNGVSFVTSMFGHSRRLLATTLALAVLIVGGGVSTFAAEKAVPGDVLYPVKVGINEPVASAFAGSGEAQARHHARLAVRRVQEAETLRARGALTPETEEELSTKIDAETSKVIEEAGKLAIAGDLSASVAVRTDLAGELAAYAPAADTDATTASTAMATPMMAKAVRATLESVPAEDTENTPRTVRGVLGKKLVLLRVSQNSNLHTKTLATDNEESDLASKKQESHPARGLLSGASVRNDETEASSTATSSPAFGKKFIEQLLERRDEKNRQGSEHESGEASDKAAEHPQALPSVLPAKIHIGL